MSSYPDCGTYKAVQRHIRNDEPLDDACRKARNEYMRQWRNTPTGRASHQASKRAREAALRDLSRRHHAEYRQLYEAALQEVR